MLAIFSARSCAVWLLILMLGAAGHSREMRWSTLPNSPDNAFRHDDIWFVNPTHGWIVNGNGQIYRTTDGGHSWELQLNQPGTWFGSVAFVDTLRGFAGNLGPGCFSPSTTDPNILYRTTDGGASWSPVNIPTPRPEGISGISVVSAQVIYAVGNICGPPYVLKSTNGGNGWTKINMGVHGDRLVDIHFFSADSGLVVGGLGSTGASRGLVVTTEDGGGTWLTRTITNNQPRWGWKISFPTRRIGYVSLETPQFSGQAQTQFLKTTNGGFLWEEKPFLDFGGFYLEQGIGFFTPDTGWIGGGQFTYETFDGGDLFLLRNGVGPRLNRFRMVNDTLAFAVGQRVYKYSPRPVTGTGDGRGYLPAGYTLAQNHPNPFNPVTEIRYSIPAAEHVSIRVYDMLGREVAVLVDGVQPAGTHSALLDGEQLPGGIYLYRMFTAGYSDTRKMTLVK